MRDPSPPSSAPANLWTVIAVGTLAYAACDMAHAVLGRGLACALSCVRALSLSTVALQTGTSSRFVAAAGSIANVVVGALAMWLFRRGTTFSALRYFLWLFTSVNLLNGTGYLLFSGVLDLGDWAVVISGLQPHWAWRAVITVAGPVSTPRFSPGSVVAGILVALVFVALLGPGIRFSGSHE